MMERIEGERLAGGYGPPGGGGYGGPPPGGYGGASPGGYGPPPGGFGGPPNPYQPPEGMPGGFPPPGGPFNGPPINTSLPLTLGIISVVFCCLPLGIVTISYANSAKAAMARGDYATAQSKAKTATTLGFISIGCGILVWIVYLAAHR